MYSLVESIKEKNPSDTDGRPADRRFRAIGINIRLAAL